MRRSDPMGKDISVQNIACKNKNQSIMYETKEVEKSTFRLTI